MRYRREKPEMTDALFLDAEEELKIILDRDPVYEEVLDFLNSKYKEKSYERKLLYRSPTKKNKIQHVLWTLGGMFGYFGISGVFLLRT